MQPLIFAERAHSVEHEARMRIEHSRRPRPWLGRMPFVARGSTDPRTTRRCELHSSVERRAHMLAAIVGGHGLTC
ncbi:MAG: hypothetical protein BGO98_24650 [Myxococcales bacterium 68-20]|nr:MAG: hypothetical protein BGO98_24650 [Myxococcales bacterium 68-20]